MRGGEKIGISYGFSCLKYEQIIVFTNEQDFKKTLASNPHMIPIMGDNDYIKKNFPGLFIAGIIAFKANK